MKTIDKLKGLTNTDRVTITFPTKGYYDKEGRTCNLCREHKKWDKFAKCGKGKRINNRAGTCKECKNNKEKERRVTIQSLQDVVQKLQEQMKVLTSAPLVEQPKSPSTGESLEEFTEDEEEIHSLLLQPQNNKQD